MIIFLVTVCGLTGGFFLGSMASGTGGAAVQATAMAATRQQAMTVSVVHPVRVRWPEQIEGFGPIAAWQEALVAAQVAGLRLQSLHVQVGDHVRRGQVLARYDDESLHLSLRELEAELAQVQAQAREAVSNHERFSLLAGTGGASEQDIVQARSRAEVAGAQLESLRARIASARLQIRNARILAPDDGVISSRAASVGSVATSGQELFRLIRQSRLEWHGQLSAAQSAGVKSGMAVALGLPDGRTAVARVRVLAPSLDPQTRMVTVYADVLEAGSARAAMYASGLIRLGETDALVVPADCIVLRDGRSHVFVLDSRSSVVRRVAVQTGRRRDGFVEVTGEVSLQDRVVAGGAGLLVDGDQVRIAGAGRQGA